MENTALQNYLTALYKGINERSWSTKLSFLLIVAAIISGFATYAALTETPPFNNHAQANNPKTVIWLLNIDLVILLALVALIARRILTVISGRKQNVAGSHLHVRLVAIFSIMAAVPCLLYTSPSPRDRTRSRMPSSA